MLYLLSPTQERHRWQELIQYAIVDEVHCLGAEDGFVWEQILTLLPCPLVALSATLGKSDAFTKWLTDLEQQRGRQLHVVTHFGRFNDLQPWVFDGDEMRRLHPFFAVRPLLYTKQKNIRPEHLKIIPEDCLQLYDAMLQEDESTAKLAPDMFFASVKDGSWNLSMQDAQNWALSVAEHFDGLDRTVQAAVVQKVADASQKAFSKVELDMSKATQQTYLNERISLLVEELFKNNMLPAICFQNSRQGVESLAFALQSHLRALEKEIRKKDLKRIESIVQELQQLDKELHHVDMKADQGEGPIKVTTSQMELIEKRDSLEGELNRLKGIRRECTVTLPGQTMLTKSMLEEEFGTLDRFDAGDVHHSLLLRGIGVHHAGLPARYRRTVERLFRMRRLGIVMSTSTLALGINMPSKTSVFAGTSIHFTQMTYQQEAGRAGRRGFDLRGHTVFFGVPASKVQLLLRGELPVLRGNRPLTPSLALRWVLKARSEVAKALPSAEAAMQRLLDNPLFQPSSCESIHRASMFVFYIQQLQRDLLLGSSLEVTDFAGFVAHIFWQEPGNFALVNLLQTPGLMKEICVSRETLCLVLCHFFCRRPLEPWLLRRLQKREESGKPLKGPSLVLLPPLPQKVKDELQNRSRCLLSEAVQQLRYFVEKSDLENDCLPLTKVRPCPGDVSVRTVRSPFMALSGGGDHFDSFDELCATCREEMRLHPSMFPAMDLENDNLNAYLFDFYRHGQRSALEKDNRIPSTELYTQLEDFNFLLKALATAAQYRASIKGCTMELAEGDVVAALSAVSSHFEALFRSRSSREEITK